MTGGFRSGKERVKAGQGAHTHSDMSRSKPKRQQKGIAGSHCSTDWTENSRAHLEAAVRDANRSFGLNLLSSTISRQQHPAHSCKPLSLSNGWS
ncbi:hypothetical protein F2P81_022457 [Scophthalmus maximus]|uniref:Uncharacterized protein n=1 Tax=Scophthalmus maximus TaxID=52904 RepID=A0A6A4RSD8_SCOMX|nr:hypothetical protein F2P81_022457 [Scophthalmus maximus]